MHVSWYGPPVIAGRIFIHSESNVFLLATSALAAQATFRLCSLSRQSADSDGLLLPEGRVMNVTCAIAKQTNMGARIANKSVRCTCNPNSFAGHPRTCSSIWLLLTNVALLFSDLSEWSEECAPRKKKPSVLSHRCVVGAAA